MCLTEYPIPVLWCWISVVWNPLFISYLIALNTWCQKYFNWGFDSRKNSFEKIFCKKFNTFDPNLLKHNHFIHWFISSNNLLSFMRNSSENSPPKVCHKIKFFLFWQKKLKQFSNKLFLRFRELFCLDRKYCVLTQMYGNLKKCFKS